MVRLITGRSPVHTFARTQGNPLLNQADPENVLWISPAQAAKLGVKSGDSVRLRNQDGIESLPLKARLTERIRPDCVYMVYGFGRLAKSQPLSFKKGASASQLNTRYKTDPLMGGTSIHTNFVAVVKGA